MNLLIALCIGAVAGWLAGQLMKGRGFGLVGNIIVGIIGSIIGSYVLGMIGIGFGGIIGSIFSATIGAVILLFLIGFFKKNI